MTLFLAKAGLLITCLAGTMMSAGIVAVCLQVEGSDGPLAAWPALMMATLHVLYILMLYTLTWHFFRNGRCALMWVAVCCFSSPVVYGGFILFSWLYTGTHPAVPDAGMLVLFIISYVCQGGLLLYAGCPRGTHRTEHIN